MAVFDDVAALAARLCEAPIGIVASVDGDRLRFDGRFGTDLVSVPRETSFCRHVVMASAALVVPDAAADPRFAENPLVAGGERIRFYAGAPVRAGDGSVIGSVCVLDRAPRALAPEQEASLAALARVAEAQSRLRRRGEASREAQERMNAVFRALGEGVTAVGEGFFGSFVERLARSLDTKVAFVAECVDGDRNRVRTAGFWYDGDLRPPLEYDLAGTPCERVVRGEVCHYRDDVARLFPDDTGLAEWSARGYLGVPLRSASGDVIGHLVLIDDEPIADVAWLESVLQAWGARAAAELERVQADRLRAQAMAELERARRRVEVENVYLRDEIARRGGFDEIIGESEPVRRMLALVEQVGPTDTTVLIAGETGTGKELVARAIHARSARADRALVSVNCAAISPTLVESELFGHEKGAFTGATSRRIGRFELADGATLFLDEIGDLSPDLQVKLLRVLQEGEVDRVGGSRPVKVDVRVIAATHRDLPAMVRDGAFRQDLYYRLNVFPIRTPPLRDRLADLPLLVRHLVAGYAARTGKRIEAIPESLLAALARHTWPGNVRELANVIERSVIISQGPTLQLAEWMTGQYQPVAPVALESGRSMEDMERDFIRAALERAGWKVSGPGGAAEALDLKPTTLEARMKRLGIERPRRGGAAPT